MTEYSVGSTTGTGESTTEQVKTRSATRPRWPRRRPGARSARPRAGSASRSTSARPRLASASARPPRTCARLPSSCGRNEAPANLAEQVAGQVERVGDYLKDASGDRILRDVEDFRGRQPMLVTAAGVALG